MISRLHLIPIVFIVGLVWLILLVIDGAAVELSWLPRLTAVVPVLLVALGVFDRWLWKHPWINGWFAKRPVLCGTWEIMLQTEWKHPETGEVPGPNTCYMAVRQTFSVLSMRLMTKESSSELVAERIVQAEDGVFRILGVYTNKPRESPYATEARSTSALYCSTFRASRPRRSRGTTGPTALRAGQ